VLALVLALQGGARAEGTGTDPAIGAITATASIPISDTRPGEGISRTIYFNNNSGGVLTLTLEITGTTPLTLTPGAAFGDAPDVLTSEAVPWQAVVTYSVDAADTNDYPGVPYTVTNGAGNEVVVVITYTRDVTAPIAAIVSPGADLWISTTLSLAGTATDEGAGVSQVEVSTGTAWVSPSGINPWSYDWTPPTGQNGVPYTFSVRATDYLGLQSPEATRRITVDNLMTGTVGGLTSTTHLTGVWSNQSVITVTWSPADDGPGIGLGGYAALWDTSAGTMPTGQNLGAGATTTSTTLSDDDSHYFHILAVDALGNWAGEARHLGPFKIDTVPPTVIISSPPSGAVLTTVHQSEVAITGTASDSRSGVAGVDVTTDGTNWYSATGTANWSYNWSLPEVDGQVYTLTARAQDHAGNWGASAGVTVTVDTKAPGSNTPSPHKSPWVTSTVVYTWAASSDNSGISGYWANITNTAGYTAFFWVESSPSPVLTFTGALTEGAGYYARVQAVDGVGNVGPWSDPSDVVTPDLKAPSISDPNIVRSDFTYFYVSDLTLFYTNTMTSTKIFYVEGYASDVGPSDLDKATFSRAFGQTPPTYTFSSGDRPAPFSGNYQVSHGATESGHITVTVYDKAGNAAFQVYTYTLDGDPPSTGSVTIAGGAEYVSSTAVSLALSSADAGCGVGGMCITHTLSCADTDWKPYTTTLTWTLAGPDGVNTVYAWFRDHLRNAAGPYTDTVILDRVAPSGAVTIAEGSAYTTGVTVTLSLTAADATSGVDGMCVSNAATCSSWESFAPTKVWTLDGASDDGEKTVYVWFRDRAGNVGGPFTDTILLDRQPPVVAIFYPSAGAVLTTVHQSEVAITGTASDSRSGVAGVDVTTDGTNWYSATGTANWSYNWSLPEVDGQVYTLTARAQDHAGNWGASAGVTVTVDTKAPGSNTPSPHKSPWVTSTVVYTWAASSDNSGISGYWANITNTAGYTAFFWVESSPSPALTFTEALTEGAGYVARVQAVDGVGNIGEWSGSSTVVTPDLSAPRVVVTAPTQIATTTFAVSWSAEDNLSGPSGTYSVYYYREDSGAWQVWLASTTLTQATFVSGTLEHTYVFSVTTADRAGNVGQGSATTKVAKWRVYIPLVLRNWKPLTNGSFEDGLAGWTVTQSPLPVSIVNSVQERPSGTTGPADGSRILLLGNPDYPCNGVPLGYAAVEQTFVVPHDAVSLTFKYIIWSQDTVKEDQFDRFEVYIQNSLGFADGNSVRNPGSCDFWKRVPGPDNPRNGVTTGWAPATLDLRPYRGQMVTLSFRLYSRADNWYNTYVYIDDVQIVR
jgi:hypothetical protein